MLDFHWNEMDIDLLSNSFNRENSLNCMQIIGFVSCTIESRVVEKKTPFVINMGIIVIQTETKLLRCYSYSYSCLTCYSFILSFAYISLSNDLLVMSVCLPLLTLIFFSLHFSFLFHIFLCALGDLWFFFSFSVPCLLLWFWLNNSSMAFVGLRAAKWKCMMKNGPRSVNMMQKKYRQLPSAQRSSSVSFKLMTNWFTVDLQSKSERKSSD